MRLVPAPVRLALFKIRRRWGTTRSRMSDAGYSAMEWAMITAVGGSMVAAVAAVANPKIAEKAAQIAGF
ncbi:hypothetical protein [Streptomyces sp. NPDC058595]|uniref:hypothetical protein n=1 Tax=Streptomyces sp. NPDC058595 TaxID=3346550 RepID=UPI003652060B